MVLLLLKLRLKLLLLPPPLLSCVSDLVTTIICDVTCMPRLSFSPPYFELSASSDVTYCNAHSCSMTYIVVNIVLKSCAASGPKTQFAVSLLPSAPLPRNGACCRGAPSVRANGASHCPRSIGSCCRHRPAAAALPLLPPRLLPPPLPLVGLQPLPP